MVTRSERSVFNRKNKRTDWVFIVRILHDISNSFGDEKQFTWQRC